MELDLTSLNTRIIYELKSHLTPPSSFQKYENEFSCAYNCFFQQPGENHYHLFANISNQLNNSTIIDLGTYRGMSALALSYNDTNIVHTFDVENDYSNRNYTVYQDQQIFKKNNINRHIYNLFSNDMSEDIKNLLLSSDIIFMDAGDHLSKQLEFFLIDFIRKNDYKGLVIWDDIYLNADMKTVWDSIPSSEKIDVTKYGHFSGTGLWTLNKNIKISY
jgi:predicted O-methyltransferase YrrM